MEIEIEVDGAIQHFHISGKLDQFESTLLRSKITQTLEQGNRNIICDMSGVDHINSLGLGTIAPAISSVEKAGGQILFYNFKSPSFKAAFEKAKVFHTFSSYEDATSYLFGMGDPLNVIIVEETGAIMNFFKNQYIGDERKPMDYSVVTYNDTKEAWKRVKQLYEFKKRQVVLVDSAIPKVDNFINKVKGFPIEGASVPVIMAVGAKPSFEAQSALDLADAFVQFPLNQVLFQKTFDAIIDTLVKNSRIELRNFGVFEVKKREPRKARNPRTGAEVYVPAKNVVTFKPGKEMADKIRWAQAVEA